MRGDVEIFLTYFYRGCILIRWLIPIHSISCFTQKSISFPVHISMSNLYKTFNVVEVRPLSFWALRFKKLQKSCATLKANQINKPQVTQLNTQRSHRGEAGWNLWKCLLLYCKMKVICLPVSAVHCVNVIYECVHKMSGVKREPGDTQRYKPVVQF